MAEISPVVSAISNASVLLMLSNESEVILRIGLEKSTYVARAIVGMVVVGVVFQFFNFLNSEIEFVLPREIVGVNFYELMSGNVEVSTQETNVLVVKSDCSICQQTIDDTKDSFSKFILISQEVKSNQTHVTVQYFGENQEASTFQTKKFILPCWLNLENGKVVSQESIFSYE